MSKRKWETVSEVCERWQERYRLKGFGSDTLPPLLDGVIAGKSGRIGGTGISGGRDARPLVNLHSDPISSQ
jgi:hypothetical protein